MAFEVGDRASEIDSALIKVPQHRLRDHCISAEHLHSVSVIFQSVFCECYRADMEGVDSVSRRRCQSLP